MSLSNYPPGVTGNEPQITGIWPVDQIVDEAAGDISTAIATVEDVASMLDDQGALDDDLDKEFTKIISLMDSLKHSVLDLVPEEPEYDDEPYDYDNEPDSY